jgi:HTH-type transcriptional regulator, sugar sensing transcriptional regulator
MLYTSAYMKTVEALRQIGLNEKEACVYNTSLLLGKATVEQIAKSAKLVRTSTYTQVESLMKLGLMSSFVIGKKTYYVAEAPTNLARLLDNQESQTKTGRNVLTTLLPELLSTYTKAGDRPVIRFFPGKEGLTTMREEVLQMENKELLIVSNYHGLLATYSEKERDEFSKRRHARNITTRVIYTTDPTKDPNIEYGAKKFFPKNVRIMPNVKNEFAFDIYLFDDKVCLSSYDPDVWGVLIAGKAMHESVKLLYEIAWGASRPLY